MVAQVGVSMARTVKRAGEVAEVLIVMLWTLTPAVTDVCHVQTDSGATAAVETGTRWRLTLMFVVTAWTVVHSVTADIQGQAEART